MSSESRIPAGFPSTRLKFSDWGYSPGCGGGGATGPTIYADFSYMYWAVKVNPFSVYNNQLIIKNDTFYPYDSSYNKYPYDLMLFYQEPVGVLDRTKAVGIIHVPVTELVPILFEFNDDNIPQPINALYERKIWVVADFGVTGLNLLNHPQNYELFNTVKLSYEGAP